MTKKVTSLVLLGGYLEVNSKVIYLQISSYLTKKGV